ncbi:afadin-like [Tubulanus polymorphus]|uniref:afadin-like n=1 Tax=Tubulanus polymorphus TaxID=672921 RepID=UPI003DA49601
MVNVAEERQKLVHQIQEWNENRLDLFSLSMPDENNEFNGVMRFFFHDQDGRVSTTCIRVSSTAMCKDVLDTLIEKFRPDMKMLSMSKFCLYEVHVNGDERKLNDEDKPLLVQLSWGKDDREGRLLLKREDEKTAFMEGFHTKPPEQQSNFKRKLSKREKKEKKKKDKEAKAKGKENDSVTEKLYSELPETSFTRTISNPEAVMKRRRQQKAEKLQKLRAADGAAGDAVKIFGESLRPDVPYKTLVLSTADNAETVVEQTLEKYGMEKEDPKAFCLYKVVFPPNGGPPHDEMLADEHCPMIVLLQHNPRKGEVMIQIRRRPQGQQPKRKPDGRPLSDVDQNQTFQGIPIEKLPFLIELNSDGTEPYNPRIHRLKFDMTEIGSGQALGTAAQHLQLYGQHIMPRHCVIAHAEGIVTATPIVKDAEIYVDNQRIYETTLLQDNNTIRFGKHNLFRFVDPLVGEKQLQRVTSPLQKSTDPIYEGDPKAPYPPHNDMMQHRAMQDPNTLPPPSTDYQEDVLPASLEFRDDGEDAFLASLITDIDPLSVMFKLAPTYSLYMATRFRVTGPYPHNPSERAHRLTAFVNKIASLVQCTIEENRDDAAGLSFWMANASEILNFFKQDRDLNAYSVDAQNVLAETVEVGFNHLVLCLERDLQQAMPAFLDNNDDDTDEDWNNGDVLSTMSAAMSLLRRCRVNAALTIQLFSQLFHFINMWLFNQLVLEPRLQLCSRLWGHRLHRRLGRVEVWAEKQGLELAADCHLARILQASDLLEMPKSNPNDLINRSASWFKLNSLQMRVLLQNYIPMRDEQSIPHDLILKMVNIAETSNDELIRSEGRDIHLEEDPNLHLPFLLPEDGYSCDIVRDVPNGLPEYVEPLCKTGICRLIINHNSPGMWKVYMGPPNEVPPPRQPGAGGSINDVPNEPEVCTIVFNKVKGSMGLSIVAATGENQDKRGIYIKSVVPDGAAALDGRLQAGDQLLEVDGKSLIGVSQEKAAELMVKTGDRVTLKVARKAAVYHGLATLLNQPSPEIQRASPRRPTSQIEKPSRPRSEDAARYQVDIDGESSVTLKRRYNNKAPEPREFQGRLLKGQDQTKSTPSLNDEPRDPYIRPPQPIIRPAYGSQSSRDASNRSKSTSNLDSDVEHEESRKRNQSSSTLPREYHQHQQQQQLQNEYTRRPDNQFSKSNPNLANAGIDKNAPYYGCDVNMRNNDPYGNSRPPVNSEHDRPRSRYQDNSTDVNQYRPKSDELENPKMQEWHQKYNDQPPHDVSNQSIRSDFANQGGRPDSYYQQQQINPNYMNQSQNALRQEPAGQSYNNRPEIPQSPTYDQRSPNYYPPPPSQENQPDPATGYRHEPQGQTARQDSMRRIEDEFDVPRKKNEFTQPSFYQNTQPLSREMTPPFFQLKNKERALTTPPKPKVAQKPDMPKITQHEIPKLSIDHTRTQPHFYEGDKQPFSYGQPQLRMNGNVEQRREPEYRLSSGSKRPPSENRSSLYNQDNQIPRSPSAYNYEPRVIFKTFPEKTNEAPDLPPPPSDHLPPPPPDNNEHINQEVPDLPPPPPPPTAYQYEHDIDDPYGKRLPENQRYQPPSMAPQSNFDKLSPTYPPYSSNNSADRFKTINTHESQAKLRIVLPEAPASPSPWEKEEKEREAKQRERDSWLIREREIAELQAKGHLTNEELSRLQHLRIEQEFQRRVKEAEEKDDDEDDNDHDILDKAKTRQKFTGMIIEELEKSQIMRKQQEEKEKIRDIEIEKESQERHERMLQMYDQEREEQRQRLQRKHERQEREHEALLRKQRVGGQLDAPRMSFHEEIREKQRMEQEENKRIVLQEEEKLKQKRLEEIRRKKEMEKEQLREMQEVREAEERTMREEEQRRRQEDERRRQEQMEHLQYTKPLTSSYANYQQPYSPQDSNQNRPEFNISVNNQNINSSGPRKVHNERSDGPPPPQRNSSYALMNQHRQQPPSQNTNRTSRIPPAVPPKKSVSFDTNLTTEVYKNNNNSTNSGIPASLSMQGFQPYEPNTAPKSYRTNSSSSSGFQPHTPTSPSTPGSIFDYDPDSTPPQKSQPHYMVTNTPGVVGGQEVYRDPRSRIEATKRSSQHDDSRAPGEKLTFREKMKLFAQEAGENTPVEKNKTSRTQQLLEHQFATP